MIRKHIEIIIRSEFKEESRHPQDENNELNVRIVMGWVLENAKIGSLFFTLGASKNTVEKYWTHKVTLKIFKLHNLL